MTQAPTPSASICLARARQSLEGLSVGDAFGERFFLSDEFRPGRQYYDPDDRARELIRQRATPFPPPWPYTDDTQMALSLVSVLRRFGCIEQDALAAGFAEHFQAKRSYGCAAFELLMRIRAGQDWRSESRAMFMGQGSFGNGSAMRVAPLGAYFAEDLAQAAEQARRSAEVTHTHAEGIAGAVAVAIAAALASRCEGQGRPSFEAFLDNVVEWTPKSEVQRRLEKARHLGADAAPEKVAAKVGSGEEVSAQDTVPFCIWCSAVHLDNYEDALWATVAGLGDRDTTCAIVGGIVVMYTGVEAIPRAWRESREALPEWAWTE